MTNYNPNAADRSGVPEEETTGTSIDDKGQGTTTGPAGGTRDNAVAGWMLLPIIAGTLIGGFLWLVGWESAAILCGVVAIGSLSVVTTGAVVLGLQGLEGAWETRTRKKEEKT